MLITDAVRIPDLLQLDYKTETTLMKSLSKALIQSRNALRCSFNMDGRLK